MSEEDKQLKLRRDPSKDIDGLIMCLMILAIMGLCIFGFIMQNKFNEKIEACNKQLQECKNKDNHFIIENEEGFKYELNKIERDPSR